MQTRLESCLPALARSFGNFTVRRTPAIRLIALTLI
jgi:hypothetical protein